MAIDNFIPEIWAAGVNTAFFQNQVVIPTLTTTYSGEARKGNVVHVTGAVTPTISSYSGSISAEALSDTTVELLINQAKAFSFKVDDVNKVQAAGTFDQWTVAAGRGLAEAAESYVIGQMLDGGTDAGSPVINSGETAKAAIRQVRTALSAAKVPANGRYCVVNSAMADLLLAGMSDVAAAGNDGELRLGVIGRLYGMVILESALFDETAPQAIGYHEAAVPFVSQLDKVEALRDTTSFSDIVRGLHVYGSKVTLADAVQYVTAD